MKEVREIIFLVREDPEGGYVAEAVGVPIVPQAESREDLHDMVRDAVRCHDDENDPERPRRIHLLHFIRDEVLTA